MRRLIEANSLHVPRFGQPQGSREQLRHRVRHRSTSPESAHRTPNRYPASSGLSTTRNDTVPTVAPTASETINRYDSANVEPISGHTGIDDQAKAATTTPNNDARSHQSDAGQGFDNSQPPLPNEPSINLPVIKILDDDIEVEYSFFLNPAETSASKLIQVGLDRVEHEIQAAQGRVGALDQEIDRLTNHADAADNMVSVGSGLLAGGGLNREVQFP
ncbi:hypothetical protein [Thermomonas sp.]|uniref:hypothetical protein n=1 Tax=Thermomonas sp. TaxID=1971895 RepID=UPI00262C8E34|nr:hypothetical protein [Thermomonas sp.]